ncbi:ZIP family metal transporter [Nitratireductor alexandrii]|uniref:ZIP family metal transporter n=1 Tax=Nitratireductor alexandrii TaxID=2448161 RepID=UPI000FDCCAC5|nr:metal transporter [Nitratireductor alexandrii]
MVRFVWLALPLLILAAIVAYVLGARPLDRIGAAAPPVEQVVVEGTRLRPGVIELGIRADGSQPIVIAQVQVDRAYRAFDIKPAGPVGRLDGARVTIPYPWIGGEAHHVVLVTSTGATFEHTVEVAQATPELDAGSLWQLAVIGLLLGVAPVATGMLAFPAMRGLSAGTFDFLLALTVGLLAYLFLDTLGEGLEAGSASLERLRGQTAVWVAAALTALGLFVAGRWRGAAPQGAALAGFIALGIGLHNLGEGLAVGGALSAGAGALATFLVVGFIIHNVTEGIGIAAPLVRATPPLSLFVLLAGLAGLPAVAGVWAGTQAPSPYWLALCFGVGAGAIFQVMVEVTALTVRKSGFVALGGLNYAGGVAAGLLVMYATALLV